MKSVLFAAVSLSLAVAQSQQLTPTVTGAPYSADQVQERSVVENGQLVTSAAVIIGHFYRDSRGRTRTESALKTGPWRIEIHDPVAGVAYLLDEKTKVAYRTRISTTAPARNPRATVVSLGTQTIDGLVAEGILTIYPALSVETWDSVELKVTVLTKSSNGYSSRLVNLKREEPDVALFRPPAEYAIVDQ